MNTRIQGIIRDTSDIWKRYGIELAVLNITSIKVSGEIARLGRRTGDVNKDAEELGETVKTKFHDPHVDIFIIQHFSDTTLAGWGLVSGDKKIGALFVSLESFDPWITAHELGHVLGLSHVCTANLMIDDAGICNASIFETLFHQTDLTPHQVETAIGYVRGRFTFTEEFP